MSKEVEKWPSGVIDNHPACLRDQGLNTKGLSTLAVFSPICDKVKDINRQQANGGAIFGSLPQNPSGSNQDPEHRT